jgi:hypothetical protein
MFLLACLRCVPQLNPIFLSQFSASALLVQVAMLGADIQMSEPDADHRVGMLHIVIR